MLLQVWPIGLIGLICLMPNCAAKGGKRQGGWRLFAGRKAAFGNALAHSALQDRRKNGARITTTAETGVFYFKKKQ